MDQDKVKNILAGEKAEKAYELKNAVISFQQCPVQTCPYVIICWKLQSKNEANDFNYTLVKACAEFCENTREVIFLNTAVDAVSVYARFVHRELCNFLEGKGKSFFQSQIIFIIPKHFAIIL